MFIKNRLLATILSGVLLAGSSLDAKDVDFDSFLDVGTDYIFQGDYTLTSTKDLQVEYIRPANGLSNIGTINIIDGHNISFNTNGFIGTSDYNIKSLNIFAGSIELEASLYSNSVFINSGGTLRLSDNPITLDSIISNSGEINFGANTLLNGTLTYNSGSSSTGSLKISNSSNVNLINNISYDAIDGDSVGNGTVNFLGTQTSQAAIGETNKVNQVNITSGTTTLDYNLKANEINISDTAKLITQNNALAGTISLGNTSILDLANPTSYDAIDGLTAGDGIVNLTQTHTTKAAIGDTNKVNEVNITSGTTTLNHNLKANEIIIDDAAKLITQNNALAGTISLGNTSILDLADPTSYDAIDGLTAGDGVVNLTQTHTTKAAIGDTNKVNEVNITSGTTTLDYNLKANEINISDTAKLITQNNALAGTISLGNTSILDLANPMSYDAIDGLTAGDGVVNLTQTHTTKAAIGDTNKVNEVNITSGTTTLGASISANTTTLNASTTLNTLNHNINANVVNNGSLNINGTGVVSGNITGSGDIDLYNTYSANGSFSANNLNIRANSTLTQNASNSVITDTLTLNGHSAKLVSNKDITVNTININTNSNYYDFGINRVNRLVDLTSGNLNVTNINGPTDTSFVYFTTTSVSDANSSNKIDVVMNYQPSINNTLKENELNTFNGALNLIFNDTEIFNQMNSLNATQIESSVKTMNPSTQGTSEYSINIVNQSLSAISSRINEIRSTKLKTGVSTGDISLNKMAWGKVFYTQFSKDDEGSISGYDGSGYGFIAGIDKTFKDNQVYGVSLGVSKGVVNSNDLNSKAQTNMSNIKLGIYGSQNYKNFIFEEMLSYTYNMNETTRDIVVGAISRKANANFNSNLISLRTAVSYPFNVKDYFTLTPKASVTYSYLSTDSYTETGAGTLNLNVETQDYVKYTPKLSLKLEKEIKLDEGTLSPYFNMGYGYELGDNYVITNSSFQGGGNNFETKLLSGSESIVDLSLGAKYSTPDDLTEVGFDLNSVLKDGYTEYNGILSLKIRF